MIDNRDEQKDDLLWSCLCYWMNLNKSDLVLSLKSNIFWLLLLRNQHCARFQNYRARFDAGRKWKQAHVNSKVCRASREVNRRRFCSRKRKELWGGLKYIVGRNGEAPKMQAIHCAFARMAVEEIHKNSLAGAALIQIWNARHSAAWTRHGDPERPNQKATAERQAVGNLKPIIFSAIKSLKWGTCAILQWESRLIQLS